MTNDLEIFDRELRQLCRKYPDLREEIERSIVLDARAELAARLAVECANEPAIWKAVPDWPNYEVSNDGRVRSLVGPGFARKRLRLPKYKKLTPAKSDGYVRVTFHEKRTNRFETWSVHRLVAVVFLPADDQSLDVAHLDGNKLNNCVENLKWCTRKENESHKVSHGTKAEGSKNGLAVLNEACVRAIRHLHAIDGFSQSEIAERFGVCPGTISAVIVGTTWGHVRQAV